MPAGGRHFARVADGRCIRHRRRAAGPRRSGYLTFLPAVVLLFYPHFAEPLVRFHAWQSILLWGVFFVRTVIALFLSNIAAAMIFLLIGIVASLGMLFLWVVLSLKAWRGEQFELPVFGMLALRLA